MPLDANQVQTLRQWLVAKGVRNECPACHQQAGWTPEMIVAAPAYVSGQITVAGPMVPVVPVVCKHCAFVMWFAAFPLGLAT